LVSSTNKTDNHDITEIMLKVEIDTITLTPKIFVSKVYNTCHRGIKKHTTLVTRVLMKLSVLLKIIFFISLKTTKITLKIQISEVCDL
jgi:hypothetical protein